MLAKPSVQRLADVSVSESQRLSLGNKELNRVLGGGAVPGGRLARWRARDWKVHLDAPGGIDGWQRRAECALCER